MSDHSLVRPGKAPGSETEGVYIQYTTEGSGSGNAAWAYQAKIDGQSHLALDKAPARDEEGVCEQHMTDEERAGNAV